MLPKGEMSWCKRELHRNTRVCSMSDDVKVEYMKILTTGALRTIVMIVGEMDCNLALTRMDCKPCKPIERVQYCAKGS